MRVLFVDKAKYSTISSTNTDISYPPSNLADTFLDRPYLSTGASDVIEFDFGEDTSIDSLFVAYCNAAFVTVDVINSALTTVYTHNLNVKRPVETLYFTAVTARYVRLTSDIAGGLATWLYGYRASSIIKKARAYGITSIDGHAFVYNSSTGDLSFTNSPVIATKLKIKGVGFGVSSVFGAILKELPRARSSSTRSVRSPGGQVMKNAGRVFRSYDVTIPELTRDEFRDLDASLDTLDIHNPTYFDLTESSTDDIGESMAEDPIYAEISEDWQVNQSGKTYAVTIPLLEAK